MWIFTTKGFYSIVNSNLPDHLLVRSRFSGDIEALFPNATVMMTPHRDYLYRATIPTAQVITAMINTVDDIDYPNFKDAVRDQRRHPAYGDVWYTLYKSGDPRPYEDMIEIDDPEKPKEKPKVKPFKASRRPIVVKRKKNHRIRKVPR